MQETTLTHAAADGAKLHVVRWAPDDDSVLRGVVHVSHGMAEHARRYARLAEALTAVGFVVYANDHRGHGKTASPSELGHLGDEDGWNKCVDDLAALIRKEKAAHPGLPFVLFGHSMGSYLVQELLFEASNEIDAVVLSGSQGKPPPLAAAGRYVARAERMRVGPRGHSKLLGALSFGAFNKAFAPNRTEYDWLSRDQAEVDKYVADPLCGFPCSTTTWIGLLDALSRIATPSLQARIRKDLPVYLFSGALDPSNDKTRGLAQLIGAYSRSGIRDVTHRFYEGARHETLNETNRDEVTRDLLAWIDEKIPARRAAPA